MPTITHFRDPRPGEIYPSACGAQGHLGWHTGIDWLVNCPACLSVLQSTNNFSGEKMRNRMECYCQREMDAAQDPNERHLMEIHNTRARRLRGVRYRRELAIKKARYPHGQIKSPWWTSHEFAMHKALVAAGK